MQGKSPLPLCASVDIEVGSKHTPADRHGIGLTIVRELDERAYRNLWLDRWARKRRCRRIAGKPGIGFLLIRLRRAGFACDQEGEAGERAIGRAAWIVGRAKQ